MIAVKLKLSMILFLLENNTGFITSLLCKLYCVPQKKLAYLIISHSLSQKKKLRYRSLNAKHQFKK